eukprot:CAMPEP_0183778678 /NCGR_PEP_ID=MMETSP0739-20130205/52023_1 /TAXON_ID=385413 /ORGANISM="Thalassiosira miniscula, Strain CCMP1093" /LENGTH=217 /DNA_ID=CAMNT_0026021117 /DNA_START=9 /DNA_END=658 /DNA_ORIENTATION=+
MIHLGGLIIVSAITVLYNVGVEQYASFRVKQMAKIPLEYSNDSSVSTAGLRKSVSPAGIVENLKYRQAWNNWLLDQPSAVPPLEPGEYTFMYRSYVNFEEGGAIKKALLHVPTLMGVSSTKRGVFVIDSDGKSARITDVFRNGLKPISITWRGTLTKRQGKPMIIWTSTSMTTGSGKSKETIKNPPLPEKLRQIPWEIVQVEDGIVGFRRGDAGMLA